MLVLCLARAALGDAALSVLVDRIQSCYDKAQTFSAQFDQEYRAKAFPRPEKRHGKFWFKKPGKLLFQYQGSDPEDEKYFISDGAEFWMYEPAMAQATVTPFQPSQLSAAVRFLMGSARLQDEFEISLVGREGNAVKLLLKPRKTEEHLVDLVFMIDEPTAAVLETHITDAAGNTNSFRFQKPVLNRDYSDEKFRFVPPAGVRVVRPDTMDAAGSAKGNGGR